MSNIPCEGRPFLNALETMLGDRAGTVLYPCIRDLVSHGLDLARFPAGQASPQRQNITQYLAAWSRHAGLTHEQSSSWLIEYCATLLTRISRRTAAAVRHSTKSNLRYIYGSEVVFLCDCAKNPFRAECRPDCPVHDDMQAKSIARALEATQPRTDVRLPPPVFQVVVPAKQANREQFQAALVLARDQLQKGIKIQKITTILNERGLKTRTGRKWTYGTLHRELLASGKLQSGPQDGPKDAPPPEGPGTEPGAAGPVANPS